MTFKPTRILGVIPARGGSKGVPGKNIRLLAGKPLIAWTIAAAARSRSLGRTIVSTDDPKIAEIAAQWGGDVPFLRPPELATDTATSEDAVFHALDSVSGPYDWVCLLQPTSPLRTAEDIDACIDACIRGGADCAFSVTEAPKSPYIMYRMDGTGRLEPLLPQPARTAATLNATTKLRAMRAISSPLRRSRNWQPPANAGGIGARGAC